MNNIPEPKVIFYLVERIFSDARINGMNDLQRNQYIEWLIDLLKNYDRNAELARNNQL